MCIAIVKPAGIAVPSDDIFKRSFEDNPDGAGMAFNVGTKYVIKKGIKTYKEFDDLLKYMTKNRGDKWMKDTAMAFHFRIGTHGSKDDPKHTHPFPISDKVENLEKLEVRCDRIVMHNGIMSSWGSSNHYNYGKKEEASLSDTMEFIKDFVYPITKMLGGKTIYDSMEAQRLIGREVNGSRFVIMEGNGSILTWGAWVTHEGCFYSNRGFEPRKTYSYTAPVYSGTSASRDWRRDYDDDEYYDYWNKKVETPKKELVATSSYNGNTAPKSVITYWTNGTVTLQVLEHTKKSLDKSVLDSKIISAEYEHNGFKRHYYGKNREFPMFFSKDRTFYRVWAAGIAFPMTSGSKDIPPANATATEVEFGIT